jgi:hypothetical protein
MVRTAHYFCLMLYDLALIRLPHNLSSDAPGKSRRCPLGPRSPRGEPRLSALPKTPKIWALAHRALRALLLGQQ